MLRKLLCWCGQSKADVDNQEAHRATALSSRSSSSSIPELVRAPSNGCRRGDGKAVGDCVARTPTQGSSQGTASTFLALTTSPSYKLDVDSALFRNCDPRSTEDGASVLGVGLSPPAAPCKSAGPEAMRPLTQPALLSLRNLHLALTPAESLAASPSCFTVDATPSGDRPFSFELACMGLQGDVGGSDSSVSPLSLANIGQQLRFTSASRLAEEVQDMQLLGRQVLVTLVLLALEASCTDLSNPKFGGRRNKVFVTSRGGYGVVALGNWKREGRVAVKVLLSEEDKFLDSCYKEAVSRRPCRTFGACPKLSRYPHGHCASVEARHFCSLHSPAAKLGCLASCKPHRLASRVEKHKCTGAAQVLSRVLAHPNILQTYDFQTAVLCHQDVGRAGAAWERMQSPQGHQQQQWGGGGRSGCGAPESTCPQLHGLDGRMDSFELLPCASSANGGHAAGG